MEQSKGQTSIEAFEFPDSLDDLETLGKKLQRNGLGRHKKREVNSAFLYRLIVEAHKRLTTLEYASKNGVQLQKSE